MSLSLPSPRLRALIFALALALARTHALARRALTAADVRGAARATSFSSGRFIGGGQHSGQEARLRVQGKDTAEKFRHCPVCPRRPRQQRVLVPPDVATAPCPHQDDVRVLRTRRADPRQHVRRSDRIIVSVKNHGCDANLVHVESRGASVVVVSAPTVLLYTPYPLTKR